MARKILWFALLAYTLAAGNRARASDFTTLHEVVRHFQVAFVDRPNLAALLLGGLEGLKQAAPACRIEVQASPQVFLVRAGSQTLPIPGTAAGSYADLERALVQAGRLAESQGLIRDRRKLEHAIIRGIVSRCGDPWSVYLEADLYQRLLDDGSQRTGDVGLLVEPRGQELRILDVVPETPAAQAGLQIGQRVDSVAGRPAGELNELEALALMRGEIGAKVELIVEGKKHVLACAPEPKRNVSVDEPVGGIARIQLLNFRSGTGKRLAGVLAKLGQMTRLRGLVLDLRGNPGGLVTEGTEVAGLFIPGGKVVSVVSRDHLRTEVEESPRPGPYRELPLVLLVDHRSASVSEIVALALRDYGRAKIVGTKTLGKGTVQVVMELMDGSALKLSNGRYYSPKGTPLFEGIEPDEEVRWDGTGPDQPLARARALLGG